MNFSRCMQMFSRYRAVGRLAVTVAYMKGEDLHNRKHNSWLDWFWGSFGSRTEDKKPSVDDIQRRLRENQKELEIQKEFEFYFKLQRIVNEAEKFDSSYRLNYLKGLLKLKSKHQENMQFFNKLDGTGKNFSYQTTISMVLDALTLDVEKNEERPVVMRHRDASSGALHILITHPEDMIELIPDLNVFPFMLFFPPSIQEYLKKYKTQKSRSKASKKTLTEEEKQKEEEEKKARVEEAEEWLREIGNLKHEKLMNNELLLLNYLRIQMKQQIQNDNFHVRQDGTARFSISFQVTTASGEPKTLRIYLRSEDSDGKAIVWTSAKDYLGKSVKIEAFEIVTAHLE